MRSVELHNCKIGQQSAQLSWPMALITFKDLVPKYLISRKQQNVTLQGSYLETHTL